MLRRSRSFGSAIITPLIPCSAANLSERALVSGSQSCGCGFCTGWGKTCSSLSVVVVACTGFAGGVHVGIAELHHLFQPASRLVALAVGDGLLVVPLGV